MEKVVSALEAIKTKAGAEAVLLTTRDGLILQSAAGTDADLEAIAAYGASYVSVSERMAEDTKRGNTQAVIVIFRGKVLVITPLGSSVVAIVVGSRNAHLGNLRIQLRRGIDDLAVAVRDEMPEITLDTAAVLSSPEGASPPSTGPKVRPRVPPRASAPRAPHPHDGSKRDGTQPVDLARAGGETTPRKVQEAAPQAKAAPTSAPQAPEPTTVKPTPPDVRKPAPAEAPAARPDQGPSPTAVKPPPPDIRKPAPPTPAARPDQGASPTAVKPPPPDIRKPASPAETPAARPDQGPSPTAVKPTPPDLQRPGPPAAAPAGRGDQAPARASAESAPTSPLIPTRTSQPPLGDTRHLIARINQELGQMRTRPGVFALAVLALEGLAEATPPIAQQTAERLTRLFADRLQKALRTGDMAAQMDDGTFGVLLPGVKSDQAKAVVARIIAQVLDGNLGHPRNEVTFRLRAGIATFPEAGASAESVMRQATAALFRARIEAALSAAREHPAEFSVAVLVLDGLEKGTATMRDPARLQVIPLFAQRVEKTLRASDVATQLDDRKFGLLLSGVNHQQARAIVQRIADQVLKDNLGRPRNEATFRLRAGVATFPEAGPSAESLLAHAETTLELMTL